MKRMLYVSLVCVLCFIVSCQAHWTEDVPIPDSGSKKENRLTVEDVKARFAKVKPQLLALTRAANNEISIIPSDFSPQWDCSIWSSDRETESIEAMIGGSTKFVAQWDAEKLVAVHQRILVISDSQDSLPSIGIETLIPTPEFYALHPEDFDKHFVNCDWRKRDFSGIILLHQFDGLLSRIVRVDNGLFVASYSAYNDWVSDDYQRVESEVDFMMSGVKIYNSASIGALSRVVIDVDPVIVIGNRPCGRCFKRICRCKASEEEVKSWLEFQDNDLFLGDQGGGGGGDLPDEDIANKDTTTIPIKAEAGVDLVRLSEIFKQIANNCIGQYLLSILFLDKITFNGIATYNNPYTTGQNTYYPGSGKSEITLRHDTYYGDKAHIVMIHELYHSLDVRAKPMADIEMAAHLFSNLYAGYTESAPTTDTYGTVVLNELMTSMTNDYSQKDISLEQYNMLYSLFYPYNMYRDGDFKPSSDLRLPQILQDLKKSGCI